MSEDEEVMKVEAMTIEYKDGQLQIVEVTPFEGEKSEQILPDVIRPDDANNGQKYMQVIDAEKGLMQLDLLNFTLVRCEDGEESYRLIPNAVQDGGDGAETTVTCVLHSSDNEEADSQESYVVMEGDQGLVFLQSSLDSDQLQTLPQPQDMQGSQTLQLADQTLYANGMKPLAPKKQKDDLKNTHAGKPSPQELIDKAKALQKAKSINYHTRIGKRGRRRKGELPPPIEMLTSPDFRLFLYACKLCTFRCNAVKELAAHRSSAHGPSSRKGATTRAGGSLQCRRCPFRGNTHGQLIKHVNTTHNNTEPDSTGSIINRVSLDSKEVEEADILVCGACGFESGDKQEFRDHIVNEHGATTT